LDFEVDDRIGHTESGKEYKDSVPDGAAWEK
jgi:hypothetical protein